MHYPLLTNKHCSLQVKQALKLLQNWGTQVKEDRSYDKLPVSYSTEDQNKVTVNSYCSWEAQKNPQPQSERNHPLNGLAGSPRRNSCSQNDTLSVVFLTHARPHLTQITFIFQLWWANRRRENPAGTDTRKHSECKNVFLKDCEIRWCVGDTLLANALIITTAVWTSTEKWPTLKKEAS